MHNKKGARALFTLCFWFLSFLSFYSFFQCSDVNGWCMLLLMMMMIKRFMDIVGFDSVEFVIVQSAHIKLHVATRFIKPVLRSSL